MVNRAFQNILKPGHNCMSLRKIANTGVLVDGRDYYRAFYHAALEARHYILISGWQFDTTVQLLRGEDRREAKTETGFIRFLNSLCERRNKLHIYILAWDFSFIFIMEREWLQELLFDMEAHERIHFYFDKQHPIGASQHQKFVVIDATIAFLGGMDICESRWDDRSHYFGNPHRITAEGLPYPPYHDIQSYITGPMIKQLTELFLRRWHTATSERIILKTVKPYSYSKIAPAIPLSASLAALSRTQARTFLDPRQILEIRSLYLDAIDSAEQLIYIENQYFSSSALYKALIRRMQAAGRQKVQIIIILPKKPQAFLEELSLGLAQTKILRSLKEIAQHTGHTLAIYYTVSLTEGGGEVPVYIHSKVLIVDDRFVSIGSANTTNRSLGLDSELNISWEAVSPAQHTLIRSIRRLRASLLAEHSGVDCRELLRIRGLTGVLNAVAGPPHSRLRHHSMETFFDEIGWLPGGLVIDPDSPFIEENIYEIISPAGASVFTEGITLLKKWYLSRKSPPVNPARPR